MDGGERPLILRVAVEQQRSSRSSFADARAHSQLEVVQNLRKLSLIFIAFFLLSNVLYAQTTEDQLIDEMVSQVDTEELRLIVEQLSGAMPLDDGSLIDTRRAGTEGNKKAADYIAEHILI